MNDDQPKQVVVERERRSSSGIVIAVVVLAIIVLVAIFGLPYLTGGNNSSTQLEVTPAPTAPNTAN